MTHFFLQMGYSLYATCPDDGGAGGYRIPSKALVPPTSSCRPTNTVVAMRWLFTWRLLTRRLSDVAAARAVTPSCPRPALALLQAADTMAAETMAAETMHAEVSFWLEWLQHGGCSTAAVTRRRLHDGC